MFWNSLKTPGRWAPNGFSVFLALKATFTQENFAFFLENFRIWAEKFGCVGHESGLASEWSSNSLVIEWCPTSSWIDFLRVPNFEKKRYPESSKIGPTCWQSEIFDWTAKSLINKKWFLYKGFFRGRKFYALRISRFSFMKSQKVLRSEGKNFTKIFKGLLALFSL